MPAKPAFRPYIPASARLPELTPRALLLGMVLGLIFGASSLYLVLKVGLTVSASIPVAVIAVTLFRLTHRAGGRDATVLENNIAQTAGSAGESIAFGLGVTMPAILILGFDLELTRVMLVAVLGSLLGILLMIPLRRSLIVAAHGQLQYPEGTACGEVLKPAASGESRAAAGVAGTAGDGEARQRAALIFGGFAVGLAYKVANIALKGWKDVAGWSFGPPLKSASVALEVSPELLGVGYIIGPRIAATMLAGGVIGMLRALPTIWHSLRAGVAGWGAAGDGENAQARRTERDLAMKWVLAGIVLILAAISIAGPLHMNLLGAVLILVFGFLFVTVSSRLTGEIGSSSNPISGMTVATLLLTCLIFLLVGWTGGAYYVTALSVGAIVCIAASNGGSTSQDLKTGHLLGATPRSQQISILIGALVSALALGPVLLKLNEAATVYVPAAQIAPGLVAEAAQLGPEEALQGPLAAQDAGRYHPWHKTDDIGGPPGKYLVDGAGRAVWLVDPGINGSHTTRPDGSEVRKYDAPKAVLMSYIIKGILDRQLPWGLVLFGVVLAVVLELAGVPSLPFAVGVYLPISPSAPLFAGGLVRRLAERGAAPAPGPDEDERSGSDSRPGVLLASGYIAGGALAGIVIAFSAGVLGGFDQAVGNWATANNPLCAGPYADWLSLLPFAGLAVLLYVRGRA